MKKILALLLMLSVVAGMTLPAMAKAEAESNSNGGTTAGDLNINQDGSNFATYSVSVSLNAEPQTNSIGDILSKTGDNTNGAVATFAGSAKAEDANSGKATSGSSGSGATSGSSDASVDDIKDNHDDVNANPEAETGNANSESQTGDASTGNAKNTANVQGNSNSADANNNDLTSGNVDNHITQLNTITQITPIKIDNNQELKQKANVFSVQDASSDPYQLTIAKDKKTDITKTDIKKTDISLDESPFEVQLE